MSSQEPKLAGTWKLLTWERHLDGAVADKPFGEAPVGLLSYDPNGFVHVQMMRPDRRRLEPSAMKPPISEEAAKAIYSIHNSFVAYAGRYEIEKGTDRVMHHVQTAFDPVMVGTVLIRLFDLKGDVLVLRTEPLKRHGKMMVGVLTWGRLRPASAS